MRKEFSYADARPSGIVLGETESDIIEAAALKVAAQYADYSLHSTDLLHAVELAAAALPSRVRRALISFRDESNAGGTLLLRGSPSAACRPPRTGWRTSRTGPRSRWRRSAS